MSWQPQDLVSAEPNVVASTAASQKTSDAADESSSAQQSSAAAPSDSSKLSSKSSSKAEVSSNSESDSEQAVSDQSKIRAPGVITPDVISKIVQGQNVGVAPAADSPTYANITPEYNTDQGTYPQHSYQDVDDVINHQGHNASWNAADPYLYYGRDESKDSYDFAIKKYAEPTKTPGLYDVYLNVKGNARQLVQPLDIMLVVDWSGSMKDDGRISAAREGVNKFVDALNNSGVGDQINLGYIGYSSEGRGYSNGEINLAPFNNVKDQIKKFTPSEVSGGTFTQKALRQAGEQLNSNQNGHKKVIVLLTDGVPSFSYHDIAAAEDADGFAYGTQFSGQIEGKGTTSELQRSYQVNGLTINDTFSATIGEAKKIKATGIQIHGLGIQLSNDKNYLTKDQVENLIKKMVSQDQNNYFYYQSAQNAQDIVDYLSNKAIALVGTVSGGVITDPLGSQFLYEGTKVTAKSVGTNPVAEPNVQLDPTTGQVTADNLNLGKDQEIQIHYQVHLNTEAANFKPEDWYQMNGRTTLAPNADNPTNLVDFGIPSAKAPGTKIKVKKVWNDYDPGAKHPDVTFTVGRKTTTAKDAWQEATGKLTAADK